MSFFDSLGVPFMEKEPFFRWMGVGLPAWGRSAGPDVSAMRNRGKNRQRRGLPPPCGIHPAGTRYSCVLLFPALSLVWSHRWFGRFQENACFSGRYDFYRQGLILVCSCSQLPGARLPAVGTPLHQGRPGHGNRPAIGPVAQGVLVWWKLQEPQQE